MLSTRQHAQDHTGLSKLEAAVIDLRHAYRGLRRSPSSAIAAVLILAVGLGVNIAVFTIANAALFKGFAGIADQDRLVYITTRRDCCVSSQDVRDWRAASRSFDAIGAVADLRLSLDSGAGVETVTATQVTSEVFDVVRVQPFLGRAFSASDDQPGAAPVALLTYEYWTTRFAADSRVIGRSVRLNGVATTIVGVLPAQLAFPQRQHLWVPIASRPAGEDRSARGFWFAVARLADNASLPQARAELENVAAGLARAHPSTNKDVRAFVQTFREFFIGANAVAIYGALWAAVGLVLLVACANLATLVLARAAARQRELAIRLALGATRYRIVQQQVFESTLLSLAGGLIGWFVASGMVQAYQIVSVPPTQPWASQLLDVAIDARLLLYALALSVASGLLIGMATGLRQSRGNAQTALHDAGRGTLGNLARSRGLRVIVAAQVAVAVVLLAAAGVLLRSVLTVADRDRGFDAARIIVAFTSLPLARYPDVASQLAYQDRLMAGTRDIPGVDAVALVDGLPGQTAPPVTFDVRGRPAHVDDAPPSARLSAVTPGFFASLGTAIASGREFDDRDGGDQRRVVIVNRELAQRYFPGENPIGRALRLSSRDRSGEWLTIIGVAPDLHYDDGARSDVDPALFVPFRQRPTRGAWLLARTSVDAASLKTPLQRHIQSLDPDLPLWLGPYTLDQWLGSLNWRRGVSSSLFLIFALLTVLLACLGIYATVAATIAQRRQEIGLRLAVGATRRNILALVCRQGLQPTLAGLSVGLVASTATNRLLSAQLVQVTPSDPLTLALAAAVLAFAAALGCLVPAMRATRIDPLVALRLR